MATMKLYGGKTNVLLVLGDIISFVLALWLTLLVRFQTLPDRSLFVSHLIPFAYLFLVWVIVFIIADLYQGPVALFKQRLTVLLFNVQIINSVVAIAFFYLIPYFGITPKVILFIDLLFSFALILFWRLYLVGLIYRGRPERVIFLCGGNEVKEIKTEILAHPGYNLKVVEAPAVTDLNDMSGAMVVIDPYDQKTSHLLKDFYELIFHGVNFVSVQSLYEELFKRIPISILNERWFIENISNRPKPFYDFFKRVMDIALAIVTGMVSLIFYPFVYLIIKLDDGGKIFYSQERIGKNGDVFKIYKFRSMSEVESEKITRVGHILRKSRIDELPQLWTVIVGDQSLIGPRPEMPAYVEKYKEAIPYYNARHLVSPGLSGWAQLYQDNEPKFHLEVDNTREKLSYDLYYLKNRSIWLDIVIALRTIRRLLSLVGK